MTAAGNGNSGAGPGADFLCGKGVDLVDVYNETAVAFEKAILQRQFVFVSIQRLV